MLLSEVGSVFEGGVNVALIFSRRKYSSEGARRACLKKLSVFLSLHAIPDMEGSREELEEEGMARLGLRLIYDVGAKFDECDRKSELANTFPLPTPQSSLDRGCNRSISTSFFTETVDGRDPCRCLESFPYCDNDINESKSASTELKSFFSVIILESTSSLGHFESLKFSSLPVGVEFINISCDLGRDSNIVMLWN